MNHTLVGPTSNMIPIRMLLSDTNKCKYNPMSLSMILNSPSSSNSVDDSNNIIKYTYSILNEYFCKVDNCEYYTMCENSFKNHMFIHKDRKIYKCKYKFQDCNFSTLRYCEFKKHMLIHKNTKPYKCEYQYCNYSTRRNSYLKDHMIRKHKIQIN